MMDTGMAAITVGLASNITAIRPIATHPIAIRPIVIDITDTGMTMIIEGAATTAETTMDGETIADKLHGGDQSCVDSPTAGVFSGGRGLFAFTPVATARS